jgi:hypothetical protein
MLTSWPPEILTESAVFGHDRFGDGTHLWSEWTPNAALEFLYKLRLPVLGRSARL